MLDKEMGLCYIENGDCMIDYSEEEESMIKYKQMLFADFPNIGEITADVKAQNEKRVFTGGIRIGNGRYRTDEQAKKYKEESLQRKLP